MDIARNGFSVEESIKGKRVSAYVSISANNVLAIELGPSHGVYCLFKVELRAEANKSTIRPFLVCRELDCVSSTRGWSCLFSSSIMRHNMHTGHWATFKMRFKAEMLRLYRQCYALINYAAARRLGQLWQQAACGADAFQ